MYLHFMYFIVVAVSTIVPPNTPIWEIMVYLVVLSVILEQKGYKDLGYQITRK